MLPLLLILVSILSLQNSRQQKRVIQSLLHLLTTNLVHQDSGNLVTISLSVPHLLHRYSKEDKTIRSSIVSDQNPILQILCLVIIVLHSQSKTQTISCIVIQPLLLLPRHFHSHSILPIVSSPIVSKTMQGISIEGTIQIRFLDVFHLPICHLSLLFHQRH